MVYLSFRVLPGTDSDQEDGPADGPADGPVYLWENSVSIVLCILACGIEDCILPGPDYRKKVEQEIVRTMDDDSFFLSSHSDLFPQELKVVEQLFFRQSNQDVTERLRLHGGKKAFDRYGRLLENTVPNMRVE